MKNIRLVIAISVLIMCGIIITSVILSGRNKENNKDEVSLGGEFPKTMQGKVEKVLEDGQIVITAKYDILDIKTGETVIVTYENSYLEWVGILEEPKKGDDVSLLLWGEDDIKKQEDGCYVDTDELSIYPVGEWHTANVTKIIDDKTVVVESKKYGNKEVRVSFCEYEYEGNDDNNYKTTIGTPQINDEVYILFDRANVKEENDMVMIECERIVSN